MLKPKLAILILGLWVAGCEDSFCGAYTTEVDGVCIGDAVGEPSPSTIDEFIARESPCGELVGGTELDFGARCVGPVCIGDTYAEAVQALDPEPWCALSRPGVIVCEWEQGAISYFPDADGDRLPDSPDVEILKIDLIRRYLGTNADGLGIAASAGCFVDRLGPPEQCLLERRSEGRWVVGSASWFDGTLVIMDGAAPYHVPQADGKLDEIYVR